MQSLKLKGNGSASCEPLSYYSFIFGWCEQVSWGKCVKHEIRTRGDHYWFGAFEGLLVNAAIIVLTPNCDKWQISFKPKHTFHIFSCVHPLNVGFAFGIPHVSKWHTIWGNIFDREGKKSSNKNIAFGCKPYNKFLEQILLKSHQAFRFLIKLLFLANR